VFNLSFAENGIAFSFLAAEFTLSLSTKSDFVITLMNGFFDFLNLPSITVFFVS